MPRSDKSVQYIVLSPGETENSATMAATMAAWLKDEEKDKDKEGQTAWDSWVRPTPKEAWEIYVNYACTKDGILWLVLNGSLAWPLGEMEEKVGNDEAAQD